MPFYPDSLLYYIETKNYKNAFQVCKIYFENFAPENAIEKLLNLQFSLYAAKRRKQVEFVANV